MAAFWKRLDRGIYKIEKALAIVLGIIMLGSLFLGVITRYVFNSPLTWTNEAAIYTLIWMTFIGGSMEIRNKQSAAVSILVDKLKPKAARFVISFGYVVIALFALYLVWQSARWLSSPNIMIQHSPALRWPMIIFYVSVPIGFLFVIVHAIQLFLENQTDAADASSDGKEQNG